MKRFLSPAYFPPTLLAVRAKAREADPSAITCSRSPTTLAANDCRGRPEERVGVRTVYPPASQLAWAMVAKVAHRACV